MKRILAFLPLILAVFFVVSCAKNQEVSQPAKAVKTEKKAEVAPQKPTPKTEEKVVEHTPKTIGNVTILDVAACRSVENRTPVAVANEFPANIGKLYLFTKVELPAGADTAIAHIWYHGDKEMAKVMLPVKGPHWRTYSSKVIDPSWTGAWHVDITTNEDKVIKTVSFNVK